MSIGRRWTVIANPVSGRGKGRTLGGKLARLLTRSGIESTLLWTEGPGDAEKLVGEAISNGAEGVVACGGDGTLHEIVNGLYSSSEHPDALPIAIAPAGRCNDFRGTLKLPKDPIETVDAIVGGKVRLVDLGRIGERYFTTVATMGFDSAVSQYVASGRQPFFLTGTPAYLYGLFVQMLSYRDVPVRLKGDGLDFEGPVFLAATGNTPIYGGAMKIAPHAVVDDGMLDLCLVRSVNRWEVLKMVPRIFNGGHIHHPAVSLHQLRKLSVESDAPLSLWADGEPMGQTPATIEVVPNGLSIIVSG